MIKLLIATTLRFRLGSTNREWVANPLLTVLFLAVLYGLVALGFWQLTRANEKQDLLAKVAHVSAQEAIPLVLEQRPRDYLPIKFELTARPELTLVANEPHNGRDGYFVLQLAENDADQRVWINRGWIPANPDRRDIPKVTAVSGKWHDQGEVYYSKGEPLLFDNALEKTSEQVWVLQGLSFERLQNAILPSHSGVVPYIIRLDKNSPNGFTREWQYVAMKPEKHLAYAIQWFGLAVALTVIFIILSVRRIEESS